MALTNIFRKGREENAIETPLYYIAYTTLHIGCDINGRHDNKNNVSIFVEHHYLILIVYHSKSPR